MIDNIIVITFLVLVIIVGYFKSRKIKSMREYSIADRKYTLPVMVATMTATVIGGGLTFGFISSVYTGGIVYILISFGNPISRYLVGHFFVRHIDMFSDCISGGDIVRKVYGRNSGIISGVCGALYCAATVGTQVSSIGYIVHYFLNLPYLFGVIIGCGAVILYSTIGGVKAVTATDVLQFAVLIVAIPMIVNVGLSMIGGYSVLIERLPASHLSLPTESSEIINCIFMFLAFAIPFLDPTHTQRFLMARSISQMRDTLKISALVETPFFLCIGLIGLMAVASNPGQEANMVFPEYINTVLPVGLRGIAVAGFFAIVMSTADSYLNAAGITLVHDTLRPLFGAKIENMELRITQIATCALGIFASVIALSFDSIMAIMMFSFNFWCPIVMFPLYAAMIGVKDLTPRCFYYGAGAGVTTFFIWYFFIEGITGVGGLLPSVVANAIAFYIAYRTGKYEEATAQEVYSVVG